jgi:hypothetical protein
MWSKLTNNDASRSAKQSYSSAKNFINDPYNNNSTLSKIAFLILIVFIYLVLLRIGVSILSYFLGPSNTPKLFIGQINAQTTPVDITQDPTITGSILIPKSVNAGGGIEFTWSVWITIENLLYNAGQYKHIFSKGNNNPGPMGVMLPNNAPGLYIAPTTNDLVVIMNTYEVVSEEIVIPDVPLNKWMNIIISCKNTTINVYINGIIAKSHQLHGVPNQNNGDVYVAWNNGFAGAISNLWYYNYAIGTNLIQSLVQKGPNLNNANISSGSSSTQKQTDFDYLSLRWYL